MTDAAIREGTAPKPLWRALAVYRFASLGYAVGLLIYDRGDYSRLGWAIRYGRRAGLLSSLAMAGVIVGHLAKLAAEVEKERRHAIQVEAASRERERLARDIHDSVLQVRALVGDAPGGEKSPAMVDVRSLLVAAGSERVTVSAPADVVWMKREEAVELTSAVRAALANVRRHCGAHTHAWVLVEDEIGMVTVTVRDDGPGIPDGRLAAAAAAGRLGDHHLRARRRHRGRAAAAPDELGFVRGVNPGHGGG